MYRRLSVAVCLVLFIGAHVEARSLERISSRNARRLNARASAESRVYASGDGDSGSISVTVTDGYYQSNRDSDSSRGSGWFSGFFGGDDRKIEKKSEDLSVNYQKSSKAPSRFERSSSTVTSRGSASTSTTFHTSSNNGKQQKVDDRDYEWLVKNKMPNSSGSSVSVRGNGNGNAFGRASTSVRTATTASTTSGRRYSGNGTGSNLDRPLYCSSSNLRYMSKTFRKRCEEGSSNHGSAFGR